MPTKTETAEFTYTHLGWTPSFNPVTQNVTYTATFSETRRTYDIRWVDYNDHLLYISENVPYGQTPVYGGQLLVRAPANGYKYEFSKWTPNVVAVSGIQTYKAEYTQSDDYTQTKTISYDVEYWIEGHASREDVKPVSVSIWVNANTTGVSSIPEATFLGHAGYKLKETAPALPAMVANNGVIKATYEEDRTVVKNITFDIVHRIVGNAIPVLQEQRTVPVWINDTFAPVGTIGKIVLPAYKFESFELGGSLSTLVPAFVENGQTIYVNYVRDDAQVKTISYKVEHYVGNEATPRDTDTITQQVWLGTSPEILTVEPIGYKTYVGYKKVVGTLPTEVAANTVIRVNYVKDEEQTKDQSYSIVYTLDGVRQTPITVSKTVWINASNTMNVDAFVIKTFTGYKTNFTSSMIPGTIENGGEIVIDYVKDETITKSIPYSVQYLKQISDGYVLADTKNLSLPVWINAPDSVLVDSVPTADFAGFAGYKKVNMNPLLPSTIAKNGIIQVYYDEDRTVTKEITYSIVHRIIGNAEPEKTESRTATIWINDTFAPVATIDKLDLIGYRFHTFELGGIASNIEPNFVEDEQTIFVNYVRDDEQLKTISYKVEHYVGDEETPRDIDTITQQVWIGTSPEILTVEPIDYKTYVGYKKIVETLPTEVAAKSVIRVNYEIDEEQTKELSYSIINTLNGVRQIPVVKTKTGWINDLEVNVDRFDIPVIIGYKTTFTQDQIPETIIDGGEIIIDYVTDETQTVPVSYTVVRIANGIEIGRDIYPGTVQVLAPRLITVGTIVVPTYVGFTTDFNAAVLTGTTVADGTVFTITYTAIPTPTPPTPTPAPPTPTPAPVVIPTPETPVAPTPEVTPEEIVTPETPQAEEPSVDIKDEETPKAEAPISWALVNLILMILTAITSILLLVGYFIKKREDENRVVEEERELKRRGLVRLISILPAVGAIVAFFLTENVFNPMIMLDQWTLLMAIIALIQVVICFFSIKKWNENDDHQQSEKINA